VGRPRSSSALDDHDLGSRARLAPATRGRPQRVSPLCIRVLAIQLQNFFILIRSRHSACSWW